MEDQTAEREVTEDRSTPAGDFSAWLAGVQSAIRGERESDVPCVSCTACCTSSQFVHIGPDEADTLAHIPTLRFPAPRLPEGNFVLGYDENGHCPMLVDGRCLIHEHRPRACRMYDCRVFPAAGVEIKDPNQLAIARRARRWQFGFPAEVDRIQQDAVRAVARLVRDNGDLLPEGTSAPHNATQAAVLAIRLHDTFLDHDDETGRTVVADPEPAAILEVPASRFGPCGR